MLVFKLILNTSGRTLSLVGIVVVSLREQINDKLYNVVVTKSEVIIKCKFVFKPKNGGRTFLCRYIDGGP